MSETTHRTLRLLSLLQSRPVWTGPELSASLAVTTRTIRRDIERLRELGYPVRAAQGVGGGYQLGAGKALPPLLLDDEEAVAIAVALRLSVSSVVGADDAAIRTLAKLDQVLPKTLRGRVQALYESTDTLTNPGPAMADSEVLTQLASASRTNHRVEFDYSTGGDASHRRVEPYRLVATGRRWYLLAWDLDRDDWRTFRIDRIDSVSVSTWQFKPRSLDDPVGCVQRSITQAPYAAVLKFRIHAPVAVVREQVSASAAVVEPDGDDGTLLSAGADNADWIVCRIAMLGHEFTIVDAPGSLATIADIAGRIQRAVAKSR